VSLACYEDVAKMLRGNVAISLYREFLVLFRFFFVNGRPNLTTVVVPVFTMIRLSIIMPWFHVQFLHATPCNNCSCNYRSVLHIIIAHETTSKTRNVWQNPVYSPLGAVVSSPSK